MRGSALIFVIGMFAAAVVGIAAAFAMQTALPTKAEPGVEPVSTDVTTEVLRNDINAFEQRMRAEIGELTASVDSLNAQMQTLKKEMQTFVAQAGTAGAAVVEGEDGQPAVVGNLDSAINRVLDDRDRRREEEREEERTQRATDMRNRFKEMTNSRTERYAEERGWTPAVTDQVKVIMSDYMDKMGEMGMSMFGRRRGGPGGPGGSDEDRDKMRQLMDDTRAKLLSIVSEEEANQLLQGGMGGPGRGGFGGNRGGGQGGGRGR